MDAHKWRHASRAGSVVPDLKHFYKEQDPDPHQSEWSDAEPDQLQSESSDPDSHQSEKVDPDSHQRDADP